MNKKEIDLLCHFLELASNEFGNHRCNDVEEEVFKEVDKIIWNILVLDYPNELKRYKKLKKQMGVEG